MSRDLAAGCSLLRAAWPRVRVRIQVEPERDAIPYCVERSLAEQQAEYAKGRTIPGRQVTNADGIIILSKHQRQIRHGEMACHALDGEMFYKGKGDWAVASYALLMQAGEAEGLISGLDWNDNGILDSNEHVFMGPHDGPHLECFGKIIVMSAKRVSSADPTANPSAPESSGTAIDE